MSWQPRTVSDEARCGCDVTTTEEEEEEPATEEAKTLREEL